MTDETTSRKDQLGFLIHFGQHKLSQSLPVLANLIWLNLQEWIRTSSLIILCQRNRRYLGFGCDINFQQHSQDQEIIYSSCISLLGPTLLTGISSWQNSTLRTARKVLKKSAEEQTNKFLFMQVSCRKIILSSKIYFFFAGIRKFKQLILPGKGENNRQHIFKYPNQSLMV